MNECTACICVCRPQLAPARAASSVLQHHAPSARSWHTLSVLRTVAAWLAVLMSMAAGEASPGAHIAAVRPRPLLAVQGVLCPPVGQHIVQADQLANGETVALSKHWHAIHNLDGAI